MSEGKCPAFDNICWMLLLLQQQLLTRGLQSSISYPA